VLLLQKVMLCILVVSSFALAALVLPTEAKAQSSFASAAEVEAAIRYHFPAEAEDAMVAIAACESGLGTDIYNEYSGAYGILQELPSTAYYYGHDYAALSDPWYAADAAYDLYLDAGFSPWACAY
jgi:hypothetical protein